MALASTNAKISVDTGKTNYLFPLILVTSLFFLWGLAYGLLDVLNKCDPGHTLPNAPAKGLLLYKIIYKK